MLQQRSVGALPFSLTVFAVFAAAASAQPSGFQFRQVTQLSNPCTPAPGGGFFQFDFEPWGMNSRGELVFAADFTMTNAYPCGTSLGSEGEGVFLWSKGQLTQITRAGLPAPGGGTFSFGVFGTSPINDAGEVAFTFGLDPTFGDPALEGFPRAGVYRFSHGTLKPVVIPGITPAPGFGVFQSSWQHSSMNNSGSIAFPGLVRTTAGTSSTLGTGIFLADRNDRFTKVVAPGDAAPGGGLFDFTYDPWLNDAGDVAFGGHVKNEACLQTPGPICALSTYVKHSGTGVIESIAHQGDPAPGGGTLLWAWGPAMNNKGDIIFMGELEAGLKRGLFLHSNGSNRAIARPGDPMPGGGTIQTVNPGQIVGNYSINNSGDITFNAALDTGESGLYLLSNGKLQVVARTGTVIPGVGEIQAVTFFVNGGTLNDRGEIAFFATLVDGTGVLLVATPHP